MSQTHSRRRFLASVSGATLGIGHLSGGSHSFAGPRRKWRVIYGDEIEPLVRLIEETERDRCVDVIGEKLRRGLSYREFMSAVFLAGLRNGGDMGYYHCIYVIHAANQLAARTPVNEQVLPLFGAMDLFKGWQTRRNGGTEHFGMRPLPKNLLSADNALKHFDAAVRAADPDGAETAITALSETFGRHQLFRVLANQAVTGGVHHPILICNCWRVLESLDWSHYLPTLRAMSRMVAFHSGIREEWYIPLRKHAEAKHGALPPAWSRKIGNDGFTRDLLAALRTGAPDAAVNVAVDALFSGRVHAGAVWDTVHLAGAESLLRYGGGNALHENTSLNAIHYAFRTIANDDDRLMILLAVVKRAAETYDNSRKISDKSSILKLAAADIPQSFEEAASDILGSTVREGAVQKAFALAQQASGRLALAQAQRSFVVAKARNDAHPYKLCVANQEDCRFVSATWKPHIAAASAGMQRGGDDDVTDNPDAENILQARRILAEL